MDLSTAILFVMVAILASNRFLVRVPGWEHRPGVFWSVQGVNFLGACYMMAWGIPGLEGPARFANYLLGLLFIYHVVQNNNRLTVARAGVQQEGPADAERERIRQALSAGKDEG